MTSPARVNGHTPGPNGCDWPTSRCSSPDCPPLPKANGTASPLAVPSDVTITDKADAPAPKPKHRKKHVPIAPPGGVPSGEVEWTATHWSLTESGLTQLREETVRAQTWFFARAAAMALFACGPREVEVVRK